MSSKLLPSGDLAIREKKSHNAQSPTLEALRGFQMPEYPSPEPRVTEGQIPT